ncbi:MAG: hypothetical protein AAGB29_06545 [Planctomycetota bacterium]
MSGNQTTERRKFKLLSIAVALALIAFVAFVSALAFGRGSRGFFDPYSLRGSNQIELLIPAVNLPIFRGLNEEVPTYQLVEYLQDEGLWEPSAEQSGRLLMYRWNLQWRDGQSMLYAALNMHTNRWIEWSEDSPEIAQVMWPEVLEILRTKPEPEEEALVLMYAALESSSLDEYQTQKEKYLSGY